MFLIMYIHNLSYFSKRENCAYYKMPNFIMINEHFMLLYKTGLLAMQSSLASDAVIAGMPAEYAG
ncbi:hypothetical protein ABE25_06500 [Cytobacillus firmus]|nr:hypothetical protein [Cytobacillus firmus]